MLENVLPWLEELVRAQVSVAMLPVVALGAASAAALGTLALSRRTGHAVPLIIAEFEATRANEWVWVQEGLGSRHQLPSRRSALLVPTPPAAVRTSHALPKREVLVSGIPAQSRPASDLHDLHDTASSDPLVITRELRPPAVPPPLPAKARMQAPKPLRIPLPPPSEDARTIVLRVPLPASPKSGVHLPLPVSPASSDRHADEHAKTRVYSDLRLLDARFLGEDEPQ